MLFSKAFTALAVALASCTTQAQAKAVFAHFILGNAGSYQPSDWAADIAKAAEVGIDGFVLNIGKDGYTNQQMDFAYDAAAKHGGFSMFISFDYNYQWAAGEVIGKINAYKSKPAQYHYGNKPLVSTFEGGNQHGDWDQIKSNTGCFLIPEWTSNKGGDRSVFNVADGVFGWDVWPRGASDMNSAVDNDWKSVAGGKPYMMGISPWFYTNFPKYNKNWISRGNHLWWDRWQEAIALQPELIEIVTWNDFGESHYIGPLVQKAFPAGCERWVNNMPHDGWRATLPYWIDQYKTGNKTAVPKKDVLAWAHMPNPKGTGQDGGTSGGPPWAPAAIQQVAQDIIDVDLLLTAPADISVQIGGGQAFTARAANAGTAHFSVPFNGQTGKVVYTVSRNGQPVLNVQGATIAPASGLTNWNAITGSS